MRLWTDIGKHIRYWGRVEVGDIRGWMLHGLMKIEEQQSGNHNAYRCKWHGNWAVFHLRWTQLSISNSRSTAETSLPMTRIFLAFGEDHIRSRTERLKWHANIASVSPGAYPSSSICAIIAVSLQSPFRPSCGGSASCVADAPITRTARIIFR
jgi:hypothetical protein